MQKAPIKIRLAISCDQDSSTSSNAEDETGRVVSQAVADAATMRALVSLSTVTEGVDKLGEAKESASDIASSMETLLSKVDGFVMLMDTVAEVGDRHVCTKLLLMRAARSTLTRRLPGPCSPRRTRCAECALPCPV
jgi:hypothetical protein